MNEKEYALPVFPLWVEDFFSSQSISEMSGDEQAVYLLMLTHEWARWGAGLPQDEAALMELLKLGGSALPVVRRVVGEFFQARDGRLTNPRVREEMKRAKTRRKKRSKAGRVSGKVRRKKSRKLGAKKPRTSNMCSNMCSEHVFNEFSDDDVYIHPSSSHQDVREEEEKKRRKDEGISLSSSSVLRTESEDNSPISAAKKRNEHVFTLEQPKFVDTDVPWASVVKTWNETLAPLVGAPKLERLSDTRKRKFRARLKDRPNVLTLIAEEAKKLDPWWHEQKFPSFDWFLSERNLDKFLEGNYRRRGTTGAQPAGFDLSTYERPEL